MVDFFVEYINEMDMMTKYWKYRSLSGLKITPFNERRTK